MRYYANFNVNNGTRLQNDLTDTNFKRIKKAIISMAKAEIFCSPTNVGTIIITDESGKEIYHASICISMALKPYIVTFKK